VQIFLSQAAWATTAASQRVRDDLGLADDVATEAPMSRMLARASATHTVTTHH
jgi:hypothetical protein